jgi:anti-sigma factor RsiW
MDCKDYQQLLDAYVDGELDLVRQIDFEKHLEGCAVCTAAAKNLSLFRNAIRNSAPRYLASPELKQRIRATLPSKKTRRTGLLLDGPWLRFTALAASLLLLVGLGWGTVRHRRIDQLGSEAVELHVRSLMASHLVDVTSTDQHTVKPWFAGRLDFSPPVVDLATEGFPLFGGRLERIGHQTAAAVVYSRRKHAINLLIWPAESGAIASFQAARDGYAMEGWVKNGMNFLAISEIPRTELAEFAQAIRARTN